MKIKYICYCANGNEYVIPNGELSTLQKAVGGYIEIVRDYKGRKLYINEDGMLMALPRNSIASYLIGSDIFGDVVIEIKK